MAVIMEGEADLIRRLRATEDAFVERKTVGDDKYDWLKTAVAFANTAPIDYPCVLYIGVKNNGDIEDRAKPINFANCK